jgi:ABC-type sugar transport system substrate-binding protein
MTHQSRPAQKLIRPLLVGALSLATLAVTACSSSTASTRGGGPASDGAIATAQADIAKFTGEIASYASLKPVSGVSALKGKTVWYVPIGSAVPILNAFGVGMQASLAKLGMNFHTCDGKFLPTTVSSCLNQAVTQGANGVVTGYVDYKLVPTAFENLVSHHIPVLIAGETNDSAKSDSPALAFDDTSPTINVMQRLMAQSVLVDSLGKAKILYIGVTDSPQTKGGSAYAKKFVKDNCSGCSFTEIDYNTASLNKVPSQVSAALISHPQTTYVVAELDAGAPGALSGIRTAGFTNKVKLASTGGNLDALQRIKADQVQFVCVGTSSIYLGWQFTDGIVRMMAGQLPVNGLGIVRVFNRSNVGALTLTPDVYASNAWYGSNDFEQTFLTAWGAV